MSFTVEQFEKHLELYSPYPTYWVCSDGGVLCDKCVEKEKEQIIDAIETNDRGGWKVEGVGQNFEDDSLYCDNCNEQIPSAYGDPDSKDESINETFRASLKETSGLNSWKKLKYLQDNFTDEVLVEMFMDWLSEKEAVDCMDDFATENGVVGGPFDEEEED